MKKFYVALRTRASGGRVGSRAQSAVSGANNQLFCMHCIQAWDTLSHKSRFCQTVLDKAAFINKQQQRI